MWSPNIPKVPSGLAHAKTHEKHKRYNMKKSTKIPKNKRITIINNHGNIYGAL